MAESTAPSSAESKGVPSEPLEFAVEYDGHQCDCSPFRTVPEKRLVPATESQLYALCRGALDSIGSSLITNRPGCNLCSSSRGSDTSPPGRTVRAGFY